MDSASSPPSAPDPLAAKREEIDRIDLQILDLIAQRLNVGDELAKLKPPTGIPIRPAREVQMLRKLLEAAGDRVEADLVVEVWRSLIAANVRRQRPVDVAVGVGGGQDGWRYFDLARRHFGGRTRIHRSDDARAALNKATDTENCVAVVPWPNRTGSGMWWHILTESRYHKLRIIAALPMRANAAEAPEAAVVTAGAMLEETGGDCSFGLAFDRHFKVNRALNETGMKGEEVARADNKVLIRLDGFLHPDDPKCGLLIRAGLDQFRIVGSFARV